MKPYQAIIPVAVIGAFLAMFIPTCSKKAPEAHMWEQERPVTTLEGRVAFAGGKAVEGFREGYIIYDDNKLSEEASQDVKYLNNVIQIMVKDSKKIFPQKPFDFDAFDQWFEGQFQQYIPEGFTNTNRLRKIGGFIQGVCYGNIRIMHDDKEKGTYQEEEFRKYDVPSLLLL